MIRSKGVYKKEYRKISIRTTDGSTLSGKVNIGIKVRVSDLFTRTDDPFIVLSDVKQEDGSEKVLFINKNHIVWVEPQD
jgi:small nuclear ribonucleoprotein (snRNP)-like protein